MIAVVYDSASGGSFKVLSGTTVTLNDLGDVVISSPSSGQVVRYNGSNFVNASLSAGDLPTGVTGSWSTTTLVLDGGTDIRTSTADASDNSKVRINGGGGCQDPNVTHSRGAGLELFGNEHATHPGHVNLSCGGIAGARVKFWDYTATLRWHIDENGLFSSSTVGLIAQNTADASDTKSIVLAGGGAGDRTRGGFVAVFGNENATTPGYVRIGAGDIAAGATPIQIVAGSNTVVCEFSSGITKANVYEPLTGDDLTLRSNTSDASDAGSILLAGGGTHAAPGSSQTRGAHVEVAGNEHTRTGQLSLCAGATGDVRVFDSAGTAALIVGTTGITMDASDSLFTASIKPISTTITMLGASAGSLLFGARAQTDGSDGAAIAIHADNHATYPGALHLRAPLDTRAASTAFSIAPVATGDVCRAELLDNAAGSLNCIANVDSAGTVTFLTSDAKYVNSSSPTAGQIGVYITGGVLTCKPGSGFTGKIAVVNVRIGKA